MPNAPREPGYGGEHAEPAEHAHGVANLLIVNQDAPLREENRPVVLVRAHQRHGGNAGVEHVRANVEEILEEPETAEGDGRRFALPPEIREAEERPDQFAKRASEYSDSIAEPTEECPPS